MRTATQHFVWPLALLHICLTVLASSSSREQFDEKLTVDTLPDGRVASKFTFTTLLKGAIPRDPRSLGREDESQHYTLFPLALGQILREYAVTEMHLTLNAGNWDYKRWGYPEEKGVGTGAELWAWMGDGAPSSIDERWKGLRNALAGLFCASVGSLDALRTTSPPQSFSPEGSLPALATSSSSKPLPYHVRHATLPSENVCTENLTPFLKLLPCKSRAGLARLLNPHRLFDADWHGMGVHVLWRDGKDDNGEGGVEVRLTFQTVMNPLRNSGFRSGKQDWAFHTLFDRIIEDACPVAQTSEVLVGLPQSGAYVISPDPPSISSPDEGSVARFDVKTAKMPLNVEVKWLEAFTYPQLYNLSSSESKSSIQAPPFSAQRTLFGSSQAYGQLNVVVTNNRDVDIYALYLETMPWLIQFYLHTMEVRIGGVRRDDLLSQLTYIPAIPHGRPTTLQTLLHLPPRETVHITMDVSKAFLRYTEHPPDAQRGWDIPGAVFTPVSVREPIGNLSTSGNGHTAHIAPTGEGRVYTRALLVDLATPDFSMPYNVIIFTCTLVAGIFGTVFNLLTRKWVVVKID
ncbi:hypothetical protein D9619_007502 [Psilocybe cf. subviscida]|uniref:Gpi16 subunit, GPI transamidase component n=1 Tax=Psilocybe cf. subviscida TaxID=2480587 RepID=A0A8H5EWT7_9AGAR|nr:hypothetical protein D9619_007502 [Psilocybe cf. subviscida]